MRCPPRRPTSASPFPRRLSGPTIRIGVRSRAAQPRGAAMPDELPPQFEIDLPPEVVAGNYADFANVWHTPAVFVMDFVTLAQPPREQDTSEGERVAVVPARVVSHIRIPPEQVFEL